MTYRDDTDAAIARADALEVELHEAERERDQLRGELEQLRAEQALVRSEPAPVVPADAELAAQLDRVTFSAGLATVGIAAIASAVVCFAPAWWSMLAVVAGWAWVIASTARDDGARAMIDTIRNAPEAIVEIAETADGRRVIVATRSRRVQLRTKTPGKLIAALVQRCPNAVRGPALLPRA